MTKQEAIQALKEGHKVRHKLFSNDEYLYMENGELYYEVCTYLPFDEFFELRSGKDWEDGWLIID